MATNTTTNLFVFLLICVAVYGFYRAFNGLSSGLGAGGWREGMTTGGGSGSTGIAGGAAAYAAALKMASVKMQDELLINKYRSDYENCIITADDYVNNLMLQTTLSIDRSNPQVALSKLGELQQAKIALNSVMKYVDSQ